MAPDARLDGWGYSPLNQIDRGNVGDLRMVWSRGLAEGSNQGTPLVYGGVMYMPNPSDVIQALDAVTGDLRWEYRRDHPDDLGDHVSGLSRTNRNVAIHDRFILNTSADDYVFALDAQTGRLVWETEVLDYRTLPAHQSSGPIVANGKIVSGRGCMPESGPNACVVTAHDAATGAELWRRRLIPGPGEPGDETWGGVPFEERRHVGAWMVPSYDPELNLVYIGTSVTSPAPKFLIGGVANTHLYHNSTLALDADTGEIVWYYQHLNDHWDLDHPFERLLVDTAVAPDPAAVTWINPRLQPGERRRVVTGIPGKTGVVYTLDRETGEFLWARPTVAQNVISDIDGATGAVTENGEVVFTSEGQAVMACPTWQGGKDWEAGAYRCAVGDQPRLADHRLPGHLRRRRPAVCCGEHRPIPEHQRPAAIDSRPAPERRQHAVRVRSALTRRHNPRRISIITFLPGSVRPRADSGRRAGPQG